MVDQLVLGTVQLGMDYGINNKAGKPDFSGAAAIVQTAFEQGITRFDTAQAYGDSEKVLGQVFNKLNLTKHVKVYSKLSPQLDCSHRQTVQKSVDDSLRHLGIERLEGLLLHHEDQLHFWDKGLADILQELVAQGKVRLTGASFYTPGKALAALESEGIDLLQVPANILDRRFEDAGVLKKAHEEGKKIFVRSVFLQGLLLMPLDRVPAGLQEILPFLRQLDQMAQGMNMTPQELAMGYAAHRWPDCFVLFGAEDIRQVLENAKAFLSKPPLTVDIGVFKHVPENILNPMLWPKT